MRDHDADMAELQRRHQADGDRRAVLDALFVCLCSVPAKPVPDWARWGIPQRVWASFGATAASWDDVFGKPEGRLPQRRKRMEIRTSVWKRCRDLRVGGAAIDAELFARVAKEFRIGERQAKTMYYEIETRAAGVQVCGR